MSRVSILNRLAHSPPVARRPWRHALARHRRVPIPFMSGFERLRNLDLFASVGDGELAKFAALGFERRLEKGEPFVPGSEEYRPLSLILEGEAVLAVGCGDAEQLIRALEPGDLLGEIAVFDLERDFGGPLPPHAGVARPLTPLRLIEWERECVMEAMRRWPDVALSLLCGMARRQHDLQRRVAGICSQRAPRRLACMLAALLEDRGLRRKDAAGTWRLVLRRPPSRRLLADMAGMARETASRLLADWERKGWVSFEGGDLVVRDEARLRVLAGVEP